MPTIYLDMDGVLADFNSKAALILQASKQEKLQAQQSGHWKEQDWEKLKKYPNLFRSLDKTEIADDLVNLAKKFKSELGWDLFILTAVPRNNDVPDSFQDKFEWIQEHYPDIRIRFGPYSADKFKHAKPGDILVDDRKDNCNQWAAAKGIAVRVIESDRSAAVDELLELYNQKISLKRLASL
jgi:5'(3')-deoxyribonucleotidase